MFAFLLLAAVHHRVETPIMGDFGYRLSLEMPANWNLKLQSATSPYPYRELDAVVTEGKRLVCTMAIFQWSRSRAKRFHLLRRPIQIGSQLGYLAVDRHVNWLSLPEPGADLCLCVSASGFSRSADRRVWEAELRKVRVEHSTR